MVVHLSLTLNQSWIHGVYSYYSSHFHSLAPFIRLFVAVDVRSRVLFNTGDHFHYYFFLHHYILCSPCIASKRAVISFEDMCCQLSESIWISDQNVVPIRQLPVLMLHYSIRMRVLSHARYPLINYTFYNYTLFFQIIIRCSKHAGCNRSVDSEWIPSGWINRRIEWTKACSTRNGIFNYSSRRELYL